MRRCAECGDWEACLNTVSGVNEGEELTVGDDHCILGGQGAEWPIEMTFDGGAREINGRRVAGAGAILWKSDGETGRMRMIRRAVIGLPGEARAQVAEAYGRRVGLRLLLDIRSGTRVTRVAGDNFNVVRYCASERRLRRPHMQELLEGPLGDCAARGWA